MQPLRSGFDSADSSGTAIDILLPTLPKVNSQANWNASENPVVATFDATMVRRAGPIREFSNWLQNKIGTSQRIPLAIDCSVPKAEEHVLV